MEGGGDVQTYGRTYVIFSPCVLQDIGPLGPLPKKRKKKKKMMMMMKTKLHIKIVRLD